MPLVFIKNIDNDTRLGLWKIADELHTDKVCPQMVCNELKQKCARRQTETVAVYALLHAITGRTDLVIGHNADGKPTIDGYNISISHTVGYASIIISKKKNVAVDIEYRNNRVFRIVDKFLTKQEQDMLEGIDKDEQSIITSNKYSIADRLLRYPNSVIALLVCKGNSI